MARDPPRRPPAGASDEPTYRKRESDTLLPLSRFRCVDSSRGPKGRGGARARRFPICVICVICGRSICGDHMIADDLKFGWRQLIKAPGFTITAVLTLGLAIGANTAVFSLVDAVLLKSLPYPNPDRLAFVSRTATRDGARLDYGTSLNGVEWEAIRDHATAIDAAVVS